VVGGLSYALDLGPALLEGTFSGGFEWTHLETSPDPCVPGICELSDHLSPLTARHADTQAVLSLAIAVVVPLNALSQLDVSCTVQLAGDTTDPEWNGPGNVWLARMGLGLRLDVMGVLNEL